MKKVVIRAVIFAIVSAMVLLSGCNGKEFGDNGQNGTNGQNGANGQNETNGQHAESGEIGNLEPGVEMIMSNMADEDSLSKVAGALKKCINNDSVDRFAEAVKDYNETIEKVSLSDGFTSDLPEYDLNKIDELWASKKGDFAGINCRLSVFMMMKDDIEVGKGTSPGEGISSSKGTSPGEGISSGKGAQSGEGTISGESEYDDTMLFIDHDANETGKLLSEKELESFNRFFSRVKTEATKDPEVHAEKMKAHFKNVKFSDKAAIISVVFHDDLDGDYLFIGHTGVLVEDGDGYLFVEKLSFQEPYQALKFTDKNAVYSYLLDKYADDYDQPTAKPFVMENDKLAKTV